MEHAERGAPHSATNTNSTATVTTNEHEVTNTTVTTNNPAPNASPNAPNASPNSSAGNPTSSSAQVAPNPDALESLTVAPTIHTALDGDGPPNVAPANEDDLDLTTTSEGSGTEGSNGNSGGPNGGKHKKSSKHNPACSIAGLVCVFLLGLLTGFAILFAKNYSGNGLASAGSSDFPGDAPPEPNPGPHDGEGGGGGHPPSGPPANHPTEDGSEKEEPRAPNPNPGGHAFEGSPSPGGASLEPRLGHTPGSTTDGKDTAATPVAQPIDDPSPSPVGLGVGSPVNLFLPTPTIDGAGSSLPSLRSNPPSLRSNPGSTAAPVAPPLGSPSLPPVSLGAGSLQFAPAGVVLAGGGGGGGGTSFPFGPLLDMVSPLSALFSVGTFLANPSAADASDAVHDAPTSSMTIDSATHASDAAQPQTIRTSSTGSQPRAGSIRARPKNSPHPVQDRDEDAEQGLGAHEDAEQVLDANCDTSVVAPAAEPEQQHPAPATPQTAAPRLQRSHVVGSVEELLEIWPDLPLPAPRTNSRASSVVAREQSRNTV